MKKILSLVAMLGYLAMSVNATDNTSDNITIPHTFNSGEIISSKKINDNFLALSSIIGSIVSKQLQIEITNCDTCSNSNYTKTLSMQHIEISNLKIVFGNLDLFDDSQNCAYSQWQAQNQLSWAGGMKYKIYYDENFNSIPSIFISQTEEVAGMHGSTPLNAESYISQSEKSYVELTIRGNQCYKPLSLIIFGK